MQKKSILILIILSLLAAFAAANVSANDGEQKFIVSVDNVANFRFTDSGVFNTPVGAANPGPLLPGSSYQWTFYGHEGEYVNFATMFVQSNDWFFAPDEIGIPLYKNGVATSGDVTAYVKLWDGGTEIDQPVGTGADQAPRQAGPDTGAADHDTNVRQILTDALPRVNEQIRVTLTPGGNGRFTLTITNISDSSSVATPLAPGVGVVHTAPAPFFINGQPDLGIGLEALAEDGNAAVLGGYLEAHTGINTPLAPSAWLVHQNAGELFASGTRASAGLEALAEDGGPGVLVAEFAGQNAGAAAVGRGASGPGPIFAPTGNYSFEITARPGDHFSLANMFVQSNDWFFGINSLPLFDADGNPIVGNVTHHVTLYDAGTEVDQPAGFGPDQAPRQAGPNTGAAEGGVVHPVTNARFTNESGVIHITITPIN
ncbi:MAG: spondin domain-containing protein [Chloroflexota bacterium]